MDMTGRKLLVANSGSDSISIIDLEDDFKCRTFFLDLYNNDKVNKVSSLPCLGPHQIIKSQNNKELYSINTYDNSIYKVCIDKQKIKGSLFTGCSPSHGGLLDEYILITNGDSNSISVIDEEEFQLIENISVGEKPHDIKIDKKNNKVYIANSDSYSIDVVNIYDNYQHRIKLPYKPFHIILKEKKIYVLCPQNNGMTESAVLIVDRHNEEILKKGYIKGVIMDMAILEEQGFMFITNIDDGYLYKMDMANMEIINKYHLSGMPNNILWDGNDKLFITNALKNQLVIFNILTERVERNIRVGLEPNGLLLL
ncbi:YncE family protein [Dethiothermospora halolimnae]|uniref:YncE family protein n=1 Tax=Dethiothermospora halolimnae TaxID=3114390 RepID=UPI003CCC3B90